ncbi:hypothetical protein V5799_023897 [Amblyomma americanum]|uniref:Uncharacterized protein n=1 Tax=Amblyomma americanum TaxID=6943 RepID=A0AAQ4FGS3_AMBAM
MGWLTTLTARCPKRSSNKGDLSLPFRILSGVLAHFSLRNFVLLETEDDRTTRLSKSATVHFEAAPQRCSVVSPSR